MRSLLLGGGAALCALTAGAGCLIPLPLEQATQPDAGEMLVIKGAQPKPFGTFSVTSSSMLFTLFVDVATLSPTVKGLLYQQVNGTCCELELDNSSVTHFIDEGKTEPTSDPGRWTISFLVQPCSQSTLKTVYLVPVIASGGIVLQGDQTFLAKGEVDQTHYWTVNCP